MNILFVGCDFKMFLVHFNRLPTWLPAIRRQSQWLKKSAWLSNQYVQHAYKATLTKTNLKTNVLEKYGWCQQMIYIQCVFWFPLLLFLNY